LIIIASGCEKKIAKGIPTKTIPAKNIALHQIDHEDSITRTQKIRDSIKKNFLNNKNENNSPIKILSSKILPNQYSNHKDIRITYKNTTKKNIKAIKLEWYCENSFEEPAHGRFFYIQGKSSEVITKLITAGKSQSQIWEDFSTDANKIVKVRAYYVMFTDGTTWELKP
jgi:hypothetical protein